MTDKARSFIEVGVVLGNPNRTETHLSMLLGRAFFDRRNEISFTIRGNTVEVVAEEESLINEAIQVIKDQGLRIINTIHAIPTTPDTQILKGPDELQ